MPWKPVMTGTQPSSMRLSSSVGIDVGDPRRAMRVVGMDRHLPALERARRDAHFAEHDGHQAGGDLLARGDDGVIFARIVQLARLR